SLLRAAVDIQDGIASQEHRSSSACSHAYQQRCCPSLFQLLLPLVSIVLETTLVRLHPNELTALKFHAAYPSIFSSLSSLVNLRTDCAFAYTHPHFLGHTSPPANYRHKKVCGGCRSRYRVLP